MNKVEALKRACDGLDVKDRIARYAREGWESIPEDDIQRLKWHGLFLRNPTPGYFMIRVRIPGGRTNATQLRALTDISGRMGNGVLDLTTRQQIQVRHLRIEHVPTVFEQLAAVGLTSMQTGMDNIRNVMTCPVAGLHPGEILDASPIVANWTREILCNKAYSNLPRKFNVAITGCPDNCLHAETQDLALVPAVQGVGTPPLTGFNVLAGGKLGSGGYRIASPLDIFVTPEEAVAVCRAITEVYRDHGPRESRNQARLAFLLEAWGEARFREAVEARLARPLRPAGRDARHRTKTDHVGIYRQRQPHLNYVGLTVQVGRLTAADLRAIADLADHYGTGEVRLSPAQRVIIPHVPDLRIGELAEYPMIRRFAYNPSPIQQGLVSCVGTDYCNLAVIETKTRAVHTAKALEAKVGQGLKPITMHWSGCPAGCGNHLVADIGLLGKKAKVDGKIVDAVDVFIGGRSGPDPKPALKLLEDVPCEDLPEVLAGLVRYHSREKLHRVRGADVKKPVPVTPASGGSPSAELPPVRAPLWTPA